MRKACVTFAFAILAFLSSSPVVYGQLKTNTPAVAQNAQNGRQMAAPFRFVGITSDELSATPLTSRTPALWMTQSDSQLWVGTMWGNQLLARSGLASTALQGMVLLAPAGTGTAAGTVVQASDARLSDARVPLAHTHSAADITSGTLAAARFPASGVTAGTYGSSTAVPVLVIDATGRVTSASTTTVPAGAKGGTGAAGSNGKTLLTTSGAPSSGIGTNGDYAIDPTAQILYGPKTNGVWTAGISYRGSQGAQGIQGIQGNQGNAGTAATITIGTVTTGAPGSAVTVTNVGTANAAILNITIPGTKAMQTGTVALPALSLGAVQTFTVTWSTPFADTNYRIPQPGVIAASPLTATIKPEIVSKSTTGCVIRVTIGLAALLVNTASLDVVAIHD